MRGLRLALGIAALVSAASAQADLKVYDSSPTNGLPGDAVRISVAFCPTITLTPGVLEGHAFVEDSGSGSPTLETMTIEQHTADVTTLDDNGSNATPVPGSLREGLHYGLVNGESVIIVFSVGGIIEPESTLLIPSTVTIAGETAPGEGITLYGGKLPDPSSADEAPDLATVGTAQGGECDVIIRHLRFRDRKFEADETGNPQSDALTIINGSSNVIVDHCSMSWGGITESCVLVD